MDEEIKLTKLAKCAGCGAKVGAGMLSALLDGIRTHDDPNLLVGFDRSDDASVYRVSDELAIIQTVDFFPPIVDDPYLFGRIAAVNALSDVYAMGGEPKLALNLLCIPEHMDASAVKRILAGGYDAAYEAGAIITGGHSIHDDTPKYGLSVTGFARPDRILRNVGARPGDALLLTKPLGVGAIITGRKGGMVSDEAYERCVRSMSTLNRAARDCMVRFDIHACTDVTGFGFIGHLLEMMQGSDTSADIHVDDIAILPGAEEMATLGFLSEGLYRNRSFAEPFVSHGETKLSRQDLLYDPQTSGGLMIAVADRDADGLFDALGDSGIDVSRVGLVKEAATFRIYLQ